MKRVLQDNNKAESCQRVENQKSETVEPIVAHDKDKADQANVMEELQQPQQISHCNKAQLKPSEIKPKELSEKEESTHNQAEMDKQVPAEIKEDEVVELDEHEAGIEVQELLERADDENNEEDRIEENNDLQRFQERWLQEIGFPYGMQGQDNVPAELYKPNAEEKAIALYLQGKELERAGMIEEALNYLKEAVLLYPDGEGILNQYGQVYLEPPVEQEMPEEQTEVPLEPDKSDSDDEDLSDGQMVNRLQRILSRNGRLLEPARPQKEAHISWLPYELVLQILRWVVSADLDATSLERASACCRGFYVAARDQDIWKPICSSTWRFNCGSPKVHGFLTWRDMYIQRPHLRLHGCYISKTSYIRHGENSFQDQFYKPWFSVEYYRYLRFFPEGQVLAWTTSEVPSNAVSLLHHRYLKLNLGILTGYYRLVGDKVIIVVKKQTSEKKVAQASNTRFRARIKDTYDYQEQIYQMELELNTVKSRRNFQLSWLEYRMWRRNVCTDLDLMPNKFPPFYFSRVKHYTAEAYAPLV